MKKNLLKSRAMKHGALATALTAVFVVIVVVINAIAGILLERYPLTIDLTSDNRYTLTEDSLDYIEKIEEPVTITVCRSEAEFANYTGEDTANNVYTQMFKQAYEILKEYTRYNSNIQLKFVDLNQDPTFADRYPTETLDSATIIVESDLRYKLVKMNNLFTTQKYAEDYISYKSEAEQTMTSAIMYALDEDPVTVISLNNTSVTLPEYMTMLSNNAFNVIEQNTLTDELDANADVVVLAGQTADFSAEELDKLDKWLDNNGDFQKTLIYIPNLNIAPMPNLDEFLKEWGLVVDTGFVAETNAKNIMGSKNPYMIVAKPQDTDYAEDINTETQFFVSPYTHPVHTLWEKSQNRSTLSLIATDETAVIVPASPDEDVDVNINILPQEVQNVSAVGYRSKYVDNNLVSSNVIVFGSQTALTGSFISMASLNNGNMGLSMVNTTLGGKHDVSIVSVDFSSNAISVTSSQAMTVLVVLVIGIPVLILALGVVTFFRRRHL